MKPHLNTDGYKVGHAMLYPKGTERVYELLIPRTNSYFPYDDKMVVFGYQYFVRKLVQDWQRNFFGISWNELKYDFDTVGLMFGSEEVYETMVRRFKELHEYGRLPLEIRLLPEGTLVPMRVPVMSITNTQPEFFWLVGYLETTILANTFVTSTNATIARQFRKIGEEFAELTADDATYVDYQFHDFSQRGQHGDQAGILSGIAHLTSFKGTDVIPAVVEVNREFTTWGTIGGTVLATEHSVMEAYGTDQFKAYSELIDSTPTGILSIVSDTYDYWEVVDEVLPALRDKIMARDGKVVVRPDSLAEERKGHNRVETPEQLVVKTLASLWDTFGGTVNSKGYKLLDWHVGVLHGEGVTLDNIYKFMNTIERAGFSTANVVFGIGAYNYSVMSSRDSFGQALKATAVVIDGEEKAVFKKPKSEAEAFKQSPKGFVAVTGESGQYELHQGLTMEESALYPHNELRVFFHDGWVVTRPTDFDDIRERIQKDIRK
ncbi:MAG: nicotinate phosphoribosyltransferase [Paraclostridium sp.]